MKNYSMLSAIFRITPDNMFVKDTDFVYVAVSEAFAQSVGKASSADVVGKTDFEIFEQHLAEKHRKEDTYILSQREKMVNILEEYIGADLDVRYDSISKYCLEDENGEVFGVYGIQRDVTKDILAKRRYEQEIERLLELKDNVNSNHLIDVNEWKIIEEHASYKKNYRMRYSVDEFLDNVLAGITATDSDIYKFYSNFTKESIIQIYENGTRNLLYEYCRQLPNGEQRWIRDDVRFIQNPENGHLLLGFIISDIDEQKRKELERIEEEKRKEQELIRRAETDGLTGLYNRDAFIKKVKEMLKNGLPEGCEHALFMIDVDNFKNLNDTQGHQVGDRFLIELAGTIRSCFRNTDLMGRLGGDEFLVLMRQTPGDKITSKNANALIEKINVLCSYYNMKDLSVSIGISKYPSNGATFEELYDRADEALYRAKKDGKSRFEFFDIRENEEI